MQPLYSVGHYYGAPALQGRIVEVSESEHEYGESYSGPSSSSADSDSSSSSQQSDADEQVPAVFNFLQPSDGTNLAIASAGAHDQQSLTPFPPDLFGRSTIPYFFYPDVQQPRVLHTCAQCLRARSSTYQREHPVVPGTNPESGVCRRCSKKNRKASAIANLERKKRYEKVDTKTAKFRSGSETSKVKTIEGAAQSIRVDVKSDDGIDKTYFVQQASPSRDVSPHRPRAKVNPSRRASKEREETTIHVKHKREHQQDRPAKPAEHPCPVLLATSHSDASSAPAAKQNRTSTSRASKHTLLTTPTPSEPDDSALVPPDSGDSSSARVVFRYVPVGAVSGRIRKKSPPPTVNGYASSSSSIVPVRHPTNGTGRRIDHLSKSQTKAASKTGKVSARPIKAVPSSDEEEEYRSYWRRTVKGKPAAVAEYHARLKELQGNGKANTTISRANEASKNESFSEQQRPDRRSIARDYFDHQQEAESRIDSRPEPVSSCAVGATEAPRPPQRQETSDVVPRMDPLVINISHPPPHIIHVPADTTQEQLEKIVRRVTGRETKGGPDRDTSRDRISKAQTRRDARPSTTLIDASPPHSPRYPPGDAAGPYHPLASHDGREETWLYDADDSLITQGPTRRRRLRNTDGTPRAHDAVLRPRQRNKDASESSAEAKDRPTSCTTTQYQQEEMSYHSRRARRDEDGPRSFQETGSRRGQRPAFQQPRGDDEYRYRRVERHNSDRYPPKTSSYARLGSPPSSPRQFGAESFNASIKRAGRSLKRAMTPGPRSAFRNTSHWRRQYRSSSDEEYHRRVSARSPPEQERQQQQSGRPSRRRINTDQESLAAQVGDAKHAHFDAAVIEREEIKGRGNGRDYEANLDRQEEDRARRPVRRDGRDDAVDRQGRGQSSPRMNMDRIDRDSKGRTHGRGAMVPSPFVDDDLITAKAKGRREVRPQYRDRPRGRRISDEMYDSH